MAKRQLVLCVCCWNIFKHKWLDCVYIMFDWVLSWCLVKHRLCILYLWNVQVDSRSHKLSGLRSWDVVCCESGLDVHCMLCWFILICINKHKLSVLRCWGVFSSQCNGVHHLRCWVFFISGGLHCVHCM
jgi:hypothetical protein